MIASEGLPSMIALFMFDLTHYVIIHPVLCSTSLQHRAMKTPQKHPVEHQPSTSGSDDSISVKVKENRPQTPEVATVKQETTPERGHRRTRSNLTDTRNVLESAANGTVESPSKGRRRARDDNAVETEAIPKKKVCEWCSQ